jgi:hypothetical protein
VIFDWEWGVLTLACEDKASLCGYKEDGLRKEGKRKEGCVLLYFPGKDMRVLFWEIGWEEQGVLF